VTLSSTDSSPNSLMFGSAADAQPGDVERWFPVIVRDPRSRIDPIVGRNEPRQEWKSVVLRRRWGDDAVDRQRRQAEFVIDEGVRTRNDLDSLRASSSGAVSG